MLDESEWAWPEEEKPSSSGYYNTALGSAPPEPKKLTSAPSSAEDPSRRVTMVRNYTWSDDTDFVRIYVPVPGVVRDGVEVTIGETSVEFRAQTTEFGLFTMALRRLYDRVDLSKSSFKVLERKEKVTIALAKFPPPDYGTSSFINYKPWCARPRDHHSLHKEPRKMYGGVALAHVQVPAAPQLDDQRRDRGGARAGAHASQLPHERIFKSAVRADARHKAPVTDTPIVSSRYTLLARYSLDCFAS